MEKVANATVDFKDDLMDFFQLHPMPTDDALHSWAKGKGYDIPKAEEMVYQLATKFVNFSKGGLSVKKGVAEKDVDPIQLAKGIQIEFEHTPDADVAKRIALDHLSEFPTYYTALEKMEKELESQVKPAEPVEAAAKFEVTLHFNPKMERFHFDTTDGKSTPCQDSKGITNQLNELNPKDALGKKWDTEELLKSAIKNKFVKITVNPAKFATLK